MSRLHGNTPAFDDDGCIDVTGLVWGTYMHGLFENENLRDAFLEYLYTSRGLKYSSIKDRITCTDPYHQLAEHFLAHVDMEAVESMVGSSKK
jgi:adenosylcobyric acid synthase